MAKRHSKSNKTLSEIIGAVLIIAAIGFVIYYAGGNSGNATASTINVSCNETDGGYNIYVQGTTVGARAVGLAPETATDYCEVRTQYGGTNHVTSCTGPNCMVAEFYCTADGTRKVTDAQCYSGCNNGACNKNFCNDTDGGSNVYINGTTTMIGQGIVNSRSDVCMYNNSNTKTYDSVANCSGLGSNCFVNEFYCNQYGEVDNGITRCVAGCTNGACLRPTPDMCVDTDGLDANVSGRVYGNRSGVPYTYSDFCTLPGMLTVMNCSGPTNCGVLENYCYAGTPYSQVLNCTNGCSNGACLSTSLVNNGTLILLSPNDCGNGVLTITGNGIYGIFGGVSRFTLNTGKYTVTLTCSGYMQNSTIVNISRGMNTTVNMSLLPIMAVDGALSLNYTPSSANFFVRPQTGFNTYVKWYADDVNYLAPGLVKLFLKPGVYVVELNNSNYRLLNTTVQIARGLNTRIGLVMINATR